jgi:GDP-4-dehydro-6-deoxy-D-mannose reductase
MKTLLIFGANGFSGGHFLDFFFDEKLHTSVKLIGVSRKQTAQLLPKLELVTSYTPDIIKTIISAHQPSYILNLVGVVGNGNIRENLEINVDVSLSILEACREASWPLERILLVGSAAEYGAPKYLPVNELHELSPLTAYGMSKAVQSQLSQFYWRAKGVPVCVARTFNLVGKGLSENLALGSFINQIGRIESKGTVQTGNLAVRRDLISVQDAVRAYWSILTNGANGEAYNICSGYSFLLEDVLFELIRCSRKSVRVVSTPERFRADEVIDFYGTYEKLHRQTGWKPKQEFMTDSRILASWLTE